MKWQFPFLQYSICSLFGVMLVVCPQNLHRICCVFSPFACVMNPALVNSAIFLQSGHRLVIVVVMVRRRAAALLAPVFAVRCLVFPVVRALFLFLCVLLGNARQYCILRPVPSLVFVFRGLGLSILHGVVPSVAFAAAVWILLLCSVRMPLREGIFHIFPLSIILFFVWLVVWDGDGAQWSWSSGVKAMRHFPSRGDE